MEPVFSPQPLGEMIVELLFLLTTSILVGAVLLCVGTIVYLHLLSKDE